MDESRGEAERDERGNPGRGSQRGRKRAENPIAIVSARLSIRFDLKEWKGQDRNSHEEKQDRPWVNVHSMQGAANETTSRGRGFKARHLGSESGGENPVLRSPDNKKEEQASRPHRDSNHKCDARYI